MIMLRALLKTFLKRKADSSKFQVSTVDVTINWKKAEELAAEFLKRNGYKILERNYRTPFGEIDIIAKRGETYVFVEVKSGTGVQINPSERVDMKKYERINRSAEYYLRGKRYSKAQIDVIEIINNEKLEIRHYKNIGWDFV
ncbi:YraN family protein [Fervidobacterium pennivorans subsp. shakshaketiis]|uniref:YraN family protein n=1 Tax=Fervidobacterium pennivorans TaxID=93466 RepID=UPI00355B6DD7